MKLRFTLGDGRARCLLGWREQCERPGRWRVGGYFVACDECARTCTDAKALTPPEALHAVNAMALHQGAMARRTAATGPRWEPANTNHRARSTMAKAMAMVAEAKRRRAA